MHTAQSQETYENPWFKGMKIVNKRLLFKSKKTETKRVKTWQGIVFFQVIYSNNEGMGNNISIHHLIGIWDSVNHNTLNASNFFIHYLLYFTQEIVYKNTNN